MFLSSVSGNTSRATVHRASKAHRASCGGGGSGDGADRLSSSDNPPAVLGPGTSSARLEVRATALRAPAPVCAAPDGLVSRRVATFVANARPHRVIVVRHIWLSASIVVRPGRATSSGELECVRPHSPHPPLPAPRAIACVSPRRNVSWRTHAHITWSWCVTRLAVIIDRRASVRPGRADAPTHTPFSLGSRLVLLRASPHVREIRYRECCRRVWL